MLLSEVILVFSWMTFLFYVRSYMRFSTGEVKRVILWTGTGLFLLALRFTYNYASIVWKDVPEMTIIVGSLFDFVAMLCFIISGVYLYNFSRIYGFAGRFSEKMPARKSRASRKIIGKKRRRGRRRGR